MDEEVIRAIGNDAPHNQTLLDAATIQHYRFAASGEKTFDPELAMYESLYD